MSNHYQAGYQTALDGGCNEVDHYLSRRNPQDAAAFEAGWFDALEALSDRQNNDAVAAGWLPTSWWRD